MQVGKIAEGDDEDGTFSNEEQVSAGSEVRYLITIDNDSNETVEIISLVDSTGIECVGVGGTEIIGAILGADDGDGSDLDRGQDEIQCAYTIDAPGEPGAVSNSVVVTVEDIDGNQASDTDDTTVTVVAGDD